MKLYKQIFTSLTILGLCSQFAFATTGKINLNTANIEALDGLEGIGEKKAQAIIDYRTEHGRFSSVEELAQVKGISTKIIELNRDKIEVAK